ncbi:MAG: hypothetical protein Q8T04_07225, partial [Bacteroidota bacterium]|nr:hypothetical protein [Bacteroidota bacterium]
VWLNQKQIAELFDKNRVTITEHIKNVFTEGELKEDSVCRNFRHTAEDGKTYDTQYISDFDRAIKALEIKTKNV